MNMRLFIICTALMATSTNAALVSLESSELSEVSAQVGINLVLDGVWVIGDTGASITIDPSESSSDGVSAVLDNIYFVGQADNTNPATAKTGFTLGSVTDPVQLDIVTTNARNYQNTLGNITSIQLKFPTIDSTGSEGKLATRMAWNSGTGGAARSDVTWIRAQNVNLNGSSLELWSDNTLGMVFTGNLSLDVDRLDFSLDPGGNYGSNIERTRIDNLRVSLPLGYSYYQPVRICSKCVDDGGKPNYKIEITKLSSSSNLYNDFYNNAPKGSVTTGDIFAGSRNLGSVNIQGIQIQYLGITTRDYGTAIPSRSLVVN